MSSVLVFYTVCEKVVPTSVQIALTEALLKMLNGNAVSFLIILLIITKAVRNFSMEVLLSSADTVVQSDYQHHRCSNRSPSQ